jgi:hypothetical protein
MLGRTKDIGTEALRERIDRLEDQVMRYGRAVETALEARAAGCVVPSTEAAGAQVARRASRLANLAAGGTDAHDHDRARALRKVAGHLHTLDEALDGHGELAAGHAALEVVASALTAALDVFARPDILGLARLQDRVDRLLDHVEHHPGLRRLAPHLLGIGTAAEFAWANHPHLRAAEPV